VECAVVELRTNPHHALRRQIQFAVRVECAHWDQPTPMLHAMLTLTRIVELVRRAWQDQRTDP
jgi:hypothetical protein